MNGMDLEHHTENQLYCQLSKRQVHFGISWWDTNDLPQLYIIHFIQYIHQYDSSII